MVDRNFKEAKRLLRTSVEDKFEYAKYKIGEGTYGVVYKARRKDFDNGKVYALKKIKGTAFADGLSSSACREISLLRELNHENIVCIVDVFLNPVDRHVWLLFDYAEHDLFLMVQHHRDLSAKMGEKIYLPERMIKSLLWQVLNGIHYLHSNWVLHRDLKPANILVVGKGMGEGTVKVADLGMARCFQNPLKPLADVDPVVVTIWYRAPELLLGARHYTKAVDIWAIGCIFAELITTKPIFHGLQVDSQQSKNPFQRDQLEKIFNVMGFPNENYWPGLVHLPEYHHLSSFPKEKYRPQLQHIMRSFLKDHGGPVSHTGVQLLQELLAMDPSKRPTALAAMKSSYFAEDPKPHKNALYGLPPDLQYPRRKFLPDDSSKVRHDAKRQRVASSRPHGGAQQGHASGHRRDR
eukprot:Clim_evm17s251 gene=Clim_evmTU17s251